MKWKYRYKRTVRRFALFPIDIGKANYRGDIQSPECTIWWEWYKEDQKLEYTATSGLFWLLVKRYQDVRQKQV